MTTEGFGSLIDGARQKSEKMTEVSARLVDELSQLDEREIIDFGSHFQDYMHLSYDANLWLGAVVILGGCGDDKFTDFRCWLITQGGQSFEAALADPDSMAGLENFYGDYGYPMLLKMGSVARYAFCKRVAGDTRDDAACERYESLFPLRKQPAIMNQELVNMSDEDAKILLPKLAARSPHGIRFQK